jgi:TetR/AcrR family transcriptional regulator, transcriptional repressor for nem operon
VARAKEFDRDAVLDRAMELFWSRGFEATSLGDLLAHLGIGRQSLYDTFGDKHRLYLEALERYRERFSSALPSVLAGDLPLRPALRAVFEGAVDAGLQNQRGCMMVCATMELCPADRDVARVATHNAAAVERAFHGRLARARREGDLGAHHDLVALSRYLTNALFGFGVNARLGKSREELLAVIDVTLSVLG